MKKIIILIISLVIIFSSCSKNDEGEQIKASPYYNIYEGLIGLNDVSTVVSNDNNLLICGNTSSTSFILKINKDGDEIWRKTIMNGNKGDLYSLTQSSSNDIYISGWTYGDGKSNEGDVLIIKTDSNGDTIWTKKYGGPESEFGRNIIETGDGNMLIAGRTSSFGAGASGDIYLLKFNSDGDTLWTKFYQDEGAEEPYSLLETMDGNYLIVGFSRENNSFLFLRYYLKVNINGEKMWDNKIVDTIKKFSFSTIELSNGDLISTGSVRFDSYEKGQVLVYKSDKFGNILWEKDFGEGDYSENGYAIKQSIDGSFTITGRSDQYVTKCDIVLLKIESNGNQIWYKRFGTQNLDRGKNVIIDSNDDIIITGEYNVDYFDLYEGDIFMTKIDKNGNFK